MQSLKFNRRARECERTLSVKYGIFILGWVAEKATRIVDDQDAAWRKALLRYNGCVRGTNTRGCGAYPDVVRREVERSARAVPGFREGVEEDHDVRVALRVRLVHPRLAAAGRRAPVHAPHAVAVRERPQVGVFGVAVHDDGVSAPERRH